MNHISAAGGDGAKSFASSIAQRRLQRRPMGLQLDTSAGAGSLIPPSIAFGGGNGDDGNASGIFAGSSDAPPPTAQGSWTMSSPQTPSVGASFSQTLGTPAGAFPSSQRQLPPTYRSNRFASILSSGPGGGAAPAISNPAAAFTASGASTPSEISESLMSFQKNMGPLASSAHLKAVPAAASSHQMDVLSVGPAANAGGTSRGQLARCPPTKHVRTQPLQQVSGLHYISTQNLATKLRYSKNSTAPNEAGSTNAGIVIDMRKSADYVAARIAGAISMTAPTTLVKRRTFTVERLLSMLQVTDNQKRCVADWKSAPWVVLYGEGLPEETAAEDTSLVMLTRKFMAEAPETCQVFVLQGGFSDFSAQQRALCELGNDTTTDSPLSLSIRNSASMPQPLTSSSSSPSTDGRSLVGGPATSMALSSASVMPPALLTGNTPLASTAGLTIEGLSRPSIIKPKPTVDVNHPMLRTMRQTPGGGFDPSEVIPLRLPPHLPLSQQGGNDSKEATRYLLELPAYLRRAADPNTGPQLLNRLFRCIDASENRRMSSMIGSNGMVTKYNQYTISAGLELGSKNRYKNIFPFDNNRVRLRSMRRRPQSTGSSCCADATCASSINNPAMAKAADESRPMSLGNSSRATRDQMVVDGLSPVEGDAAAPMVSSGSAAGNDSSNPGVAVNDYVNASYISYFDGPLYIATQGPLRDTVYDFWKMVWEHRTKVIIMLTQEFEGGRSKCHHYWPNKVGETSMYGDLRVEWQAEAMHPDDNSIVSRRLCISRPSVTDAVMNVTHLQYLDWEDHSVPEGPSGILRLRQVARMAQEEGERHERKRHSGDCDAVRESRIPMVVHCSAGCGRTGAFCAIDTILSMNEQNEKRNNTGAVVEEACSAPIADKQRHQQGEKVDCDGDVDMSGTENDDIRGDMQMLPSGSRYDRHGEYTGLVPRALRSKSSNAAMSSGDAGKHAAANDGDNSESERPDQTPDDGETELAQECSGDREQAKHRRSLTRWNEKPPSEFQDDLVFMVVSRFRELRVTMVQKNKQFVFCHEALVWDALGMGPRPLERVIDRRLVAEWNRANYPDLSESDCVDITYLMRGRQEMVMAMTSAEMVVSAGNECSVNEPMSSGRASIDVGSTGSVLTTGSLGRSVAIAPPGVKRSNTVGPARRGFFGSIFNRSANNADSSGPATDHQQQLNKPNDGNTMGAQQHPCLSLDPRPVGNQVKAPPPASSHAPITEESPLAETEEEAMAPYSRIMVRRDSTTLPLSPQTYGNPSGSFGRAIAMPAVAATSASDYFGIICAGDSRRSSSGSDYNHGGSLGRANAPEWRRGVIGHLDATGNSSYENRSGSLSVIAAGDMSAPESPSAYVSSPPALASPRVK
ncbi:hypothetical protein IW140_004436 [Coemansia sp. RSA 1813]|nr:hypothetical protein IW138_004736 [Coemansia sp. RSA 986]KAJ2211831.1 hypothetical protein EV179_005162 [Coemansia sp. RSA 487]KAJ2567528.1 hypothetical protein IW140_004436 [Coemansia sp. RSA 1813]